jgi:hypothetical protein
MRKSSVVENLGLQLVRDRRYVYVYRGIVLIDLLFSDSFFNDVSIRLVISREYLTPLSVRAV